MVGTASSPISVAIVDDDILVRSALQGYLRIAPDVRVVGVCSSAAEILSVVRAEPIDVVLMDVHMPGTDGVEATRAVRAASPATRVIMLTSLDDADAVHGALEAGAAGFLLKNVSPEALVDSVRGVHRGVTVMSERPMARMRSHLAPPSADAPGLTDREHEVLRGLCRGLSNLEMCEQLYLSESSVKGYVTSLMSKLGVTTRLKAVVRAHELGLDRT